MNQNKPNKCEKRKTPYLAVFTYATAVAVALFVCDSLAGKFLVGAPLGILLGIVVYWLTPAKQPLSPERASFWRMSTSLGCATILALASFLSGDLGMTFLFVGIGSMSFFLDVLNHRSQTNTAVE